MRARSHSVPGPGGLGLLMMFPSSSSVVVVPGEKVLIEIRFNFGFLRAGPIFASMRAAHSSTTHTNARGRTKSHSLLYDSIPLGDCRGAHNLKSNLRTTQKNINSHQSIPHNRYTILKNVRMYYYVRNILPVRMSNNTLFCFSALLNLQN